MAYVSEYGNWGSDGEEILIFKNSDLTESQWENLEYLTDSDKLTYVKAILAGEDVSEWEEEE